MDSTIITAVAAACGSLGGAAATIVTTCITQHTQTVHTKQEQTLRHSEILYGGFIAEASHLAVEAFSNTLERPDTFVKRYGIIGRIRLMASDPVLDAAGACIQKIIDI